MIRKFGILGVFLLIASLSACSLSGAENQGTCTQSARKESPSARATELAGTLARILSCINTTSSPADAARGISGYPIQSPEARTNPPHRTALLIGLYLAQGTLQALDTQATLRAIASGKAREGNPIVSPFATQPVALVAFKGGVTAAIIFGVDRLSKSHPRAARIALAAIDGEYMYVVQRDYRILGRR